MYKAADHGIPLIGDVFQRPYSSPLIAIWHFDYLTSLTTTEAHLLGRFVAQAANALEVGLAALAEPLTFEVTS